MYWRRTGDKSYKQSFCQQYFGDCGFTSSMVNSAAFQTGNSNKEIELNAIYQHYGANPCCGVLFDDQSGNAKYAEELGSVFEQVDGAKGVTSSNYNDAMSKLSGCSSKNCCSDIPPSGQYTCEQQKSYGKCTESWMIGYCCKTCFDCKNCTSLAAPSNVTAFVKV